MHGSFLRVAAVGAALGAVVLASGSAAVAQTNGWAPGPGAILDNTYAGTIDLPQDGATVPANGSFTVAGWFVDQTADGWAGADEVQIWLGTMDGGGHVLAEAAFGQARPDVAAALGNPFWTNSGFSANIQGSAVPAGPQTLYAYVHSGGKGWWDKGVNVTGGGTSTAAAPGPATTSAGGAPVITVLNPINNQNVSTKSDYTINGTVDDPANVDRIEVWINGERNSHYATLLGTTTPNGDGSWSQTFSPTHFPSTHSNLYIYAHNKATGLETVKNVEINIVDR